MSTLRDQIDRLAAEFAGSIIETLRGASLDDLLAIAGNRGAGAARGGRGRSAAAGGGLDLGGRRRGRGGRLGRRTADDINRMIDGIVGLLEKRTEGLRAEQIREALGVEAKELPRPLADALEAGRISKTGQKRATTYFAAGGGGAKTGGAKRGRKKKS